MEEYRKCFEDYEVSNFGNIRNKDKILKCSIQNRGYKYFQTRKDNKRSNHLIHHLVAEQFIGIRPENLVIDHIDRNKLNNNVLNLRYVSQKENLKNCDRYREDILESDLVKRHRIMQNQYAIKSGHNKLIRRPRHTGQIYKRDNGTYRAIITVNKIKYDKTLPTKEQAEQFITDTRLLYNQDELFLRV